MAIDLVYMCVGCIIGILIKYEVDIKQNKKKIKNKVISYQHLRNTDDKLKECDEMLKSIKSINEGLTILQNKKGV